MCRISLGQTVCERRSSLIVLAIHVFLALIMTVLMMIPFNHGSICRFASLHPEVILIFGMTLFLASVWFGISGRSTLFSPYMTGCLLFGTSIGVGAHTLLHLKAHFDQPISPCREIELAQTIIGSLCFGSIFIQAMITLSRNPAWDDGASARTNVDLSLTQPRAMTTGWYADRRPPELVARPPKLVAHPPEFVAHPHEFVAQPAHQPELVARPPEFIAHPPEFVAQPSVHQPELVARSPESVARPTEFVARPTEFVARPTEFVVMQFPPALSSPVAPGSVVLLPALPTLQKTPIPLTAAPPAHGLAHPVPIPSTVQVSVHIKTSV